MDAKEIIKLLGGPVSLAKVLGIKPPSISEWITCGIPEARLVQVAAQLELRSGGRFSRRERWPDTCEFFWPELANPSVDRSSTATNSVAGGMN